MIDKLIISTNNSEETMKFGSSIASKLPSGITITLNGDLGAGKTTFVRGVASGLHINEVVQSPTFNIMKIYFKGDRPLIHIDAYRLKDFNSDIGLDEYIGYETGITFIEWSEFINNLIPDFRIDIVINRISDEKREFVISGEKSLLEIFK